MINVPEGTIGGGSRAGNSPLLFFEYQRVAAARKEMMEMMEMWMWPKSGKTPELGSESGPQKSNCRATVCGI